MDDDILARAKAALARGLTRAFYLTTKVLMDGLEAALAVLRNAYMIASRGAVAALGSGFEPEEIAVLAPVVHGLIFRSYLDMACVIVSGVAVLMRKMLAGLWLSLCGLVWLTWERLCICGDASSAASQHRSCL